MPKKIPKEEYDLDTIAYEAKVVNDFNKWSSELFEFKRFVEEDAYKDWRKILPLFKDSEDDEVKLFGTSMENLNYTNLVRDIEILEEIKDSYENASELEKQIKKALLGGIQVFTKLNNVLDRIESAQKYKSTFTAQIMDKTLTVPDNGEIDISNIEFEDNYEENLTTLKVIVEDQATKLWELLKASGYYIDSLTYEEEINQYITLVSLGNKSKRPCEILRDKLAKAEKAVSRFRDRIYRDAEDSEKDALIYNLMGYYPDKMTYLAAAYLKYQAKINNINSAKKRKNPEHDEIPIEGAFAFYRRIIRDIESERLDVADFNQRKLPFAVDDMWKLKPQPESLYRASKGFDPSNSPDKYIVCLMPRDQEKLEPMK